METFDNIQNLIKQARPEDCQKLASFTQQHAASMFHLSPLFFEHHAATTWVYVHPETHCIGGILISWKSPAQYSTAIIEGIVTHPEANRPDAVQGLLDAAIAYWTNACVRNLTAPVFPPNHWLSQTFAKAGFVPVGNAHIPIANKILSPEKICLHHKKMRPRMNSANGQISEDTLFEYFQDGDAVWGTYAGGDVVRGVIIGQMNANRDIRFHYLQVDNQGQYHQGTSKSSTEFLNDGRIVLYENWEWTGNKKGSGSSIIEEVKE
jgi:L-amino acid N-acyltransferase YncA